MLHIKNLYKFFQVNGKYFETYTQENYLYYLVKLNEPIIDKMSVP